MVPPGLGAFGVAGVLMLGSAVLANADRRVLRDAHPGARLVETAGRVTHVYGRAFSTGVTAGESVDAFLANHAGVFGVRRDNLVPAGDHPLQGIMYQPAAGTYKFTEFNYRQQLDGVPVFRAQLKLLVRSEAGFPLVLTSADLRDLGGFRLDGGHG